MKNSSFSRLNIRIKLHWLSLHSQGMRYADWPKRNQGPYPDLEEFSQCQTNHIWTSYFYQKKSEWMLSCKNNIDPVQSTPFNYSIPTYIHLYSLKYTFKSSHSLHKYKKPLFPKAMSHSFIHSGCLGDVQSSYVELL